MSQIDIEIGLRLKIGRQSFGYKTAIEFSEKHHIAKTTYAQHESGKRSLTPELIMKYGEMLVLNPSWLLTGSGHPCPMSVNKNERKHFIDQAVRERQTQHTLPLLSFASVSIDEPSAMMDITLLRQILVVAMNLLTAQKIQISSDELFAFCLDVYNQISVLDLSEKDREKIIALSMNSLCKGNQITKLHKTKTA